MTTSEVASAKSLEKLNENLAKVEKLSERLIAALSQKKQIDPNLQGPGNDLYLKTSAAVMSDFISQPSKIFEQQVAYWGKTVQHFIEAQEALATGKLVPPKDDTPADPRFKNELWQTHPYFNYLKQQYLTTAGAIEEAVSSLEGLDDKDRHRIKHFSQQIIDLMAPTNFLGTNPEALARAVETEGESLVKGLENLVRDVEANDGEMLVTLADKDAFSVGSNIATTPGKVVFRNRLIELIQYTPTTENVHATPIVVFPPWINKFYIMDLKEKNSLIKHVVDSGYTLFVVSWINPDDSYADVGMDEYVEEGFLTAIETVKEITGEKQVNAVGYCIAGTTLSLTLGLLNKRKDKSVKSATFFTTMTDFSDQGEFTPFLDDDFVAGIEREANAKGFLDKFYMARTFSYLRANDLVYAPAIKSYMMGEAPPAFDLLYWNGDGTNLPGKMVVQYLRELCQGNNLAGEGFEILGEKVSLKDVKVPLCAIACETDHIAAWKASFSGVSQMGSKDKSFILSESGHIAGIINPPSKKKYGHYTNDTVSGDADTWLKEARFNEGSWWPRWLDWLDKRSGKMVPARAEGGESFAPLCDAPGTYVRG